MAGRLLKKGRFLALMLCLAMLAMALPAAAKRLVPKVDNIIFFLDHSGSMGEVYKGKKNLTKFVLAQVAMQAVNDQIPDLKYNSGVYTFAPYKQYSAVAPYNKAAVRNAIAPIKWDFDLYGRQTPMGPGLASLDKVISGLSGRTAVIIFSDGYANRGINPVTEAKELVAKYGDRLCFMVVSVADTAYGLDILKKIAAASQCNCFITNEDLFSGKEAQDAFLRCGIYAEVEDEIIVFRSIYFDFNKSKIKREFIPVLDEGVKIIKTKKFREVILEGHTDGIGSEAYNQRLSERRANAVKAYFVKKGINAAEIRTIGYGKTRPVATNSTAAGRKLNRRLEIKFRPMD